MITFSSLIYGQENSNFIQLDQTFSGNSYIALDSLGYMWVSDNNGIFQYNGYDFSHKTYYSIFGNDYKKDRKIFFKNDHNGNFWISTANGELTKINNKGIHTSYKDSLTYNKKPLHINTISPTDKNIWFCAMDGSIYKYNSNSSQIDSITNVNKQNSRLSIIKSIVETGNDKIWISTFQGEIFIHDLNSKTTSPFELPITHNDQSVCIISDKQGDLWFSTETQGLFRYNIKNKSFKQYSKTKKLSTHIKYDMFITLFCDSSGFIWAGTDGDGLYRINPKNDKITIFKHQETNRSSISNNTIRRINEDASGNMWFVSKIGVINILAKKNKNIHYYNGNISNSPIPVLSILKSTDEFLWIGSDGKGLTKISPNNTKYQYNNTKSDKYFFEGEYIQSMIEDSKKNIWLGTYKNGLWIYNPKTEKFKHLNIIDASGEISHDIRALFKDNKNRIWVSAQNKIIVYSENQTKLTSFLYNANGLYGNITHDFCQDENSTIWLGTNKNGLFKFNEDINDLSKSYFTRVNFYKKQEGLAHNYSVRSLIPDFNGNIWLATMSGFLIKYSLKNDKFITFSSKNNFKDIQVTDLLLDDNKNLWLSSLNGIHDFNSNTETINSYYQIDGFQGNKFPRRNAYKDKNGVLYFGGQSGVNSFLPELMNKQKSSAKLYINNIEILNKPAKLIIPEQIKGNIESIKRLNLESIYTSFSFQFSAIDNLLNTNYHYTYKLEGFDKDWIIAKKDRIATYTNIPSGNYTFKVKAGSIAETYDITPIQLKIVIKTPWWNTIYAYIAYFIIIGFLIYGFIVWWFLRNRLIFEEYQHKNDKELYALKMNFFAKMSHEIQTPLTLILEPINDMMSRAGTTGNQLLKQRLLMIKNNANRLSRIASELMIVRNKELGVLKLFASKNKLIKDLKIIASSFTEHARFKNIDFIQQYPEEEIEMWYDRAKIEHVLYNLLSNAFKFTPEEGIITLKITHNTEKEEVKIYVINTGSVIEKDELDNIFKLFYQADLGKHAKGFGIGLALTKELVSLHHGNIKVSSSDKKGTNFILKLSTNENIFTDDEKISSHSSLPYTKQQEFNIDKRIFENIKSTNSKEISHTILIVEDNIEMQMFLKDILGIKYEILIANNGKEGVEFAKKNNPDLIISDIMMPIMNGLKMCKALQKEKSTSHIPVVFLTAKNTTQAKMKGLKYGAIEYLRKPFNMNELFLKVNNIIEAKEKIVSRYKIQAISSPNRDIAKSKDVIFIESLVHELKNQMENPSFKLESLAKILNMSYSVIYRKCLDITGKTLVELVRSLRIKRAALLITKHGYNISEAAYMVGYNDSKYFSKCFKEEFGQTPNYFKHEAKKIGLEIFLKKYNINN